MRQCPLTSYQYTNYGDIVYSLSLFFTKLSILLLIRRVFCSVQLDAPYWITLAIIVLNSIFYLLFFFIPIFGCLPRAKIWDNSVQGQCLDINVLYLASASFNVISDIAMLGVPIYLVWSLRMSIPRKMGVTAIFFFGALFVCLGFL